MTLDPSTRDPDTAPIPKVRTHERRRAAIWLGSLAVAAVVLVAILLTVLGTSGGSDPTPQGAPTGPDVTVATSKAPPSTTPRSTTSTQPSRTRPSTSASSRASGPSKRPVSCPTTAPCALPDDIGDFVGALNTYRAAKNLPPVTGKVTPGAQNCAVTEASNCPSGFFWEPVGRSGADMLQKIFGNDRGSERLLAAGLKSIEVGWAYIPSSKSFECAVVVGG